MSTTTRLSVVALGAVPLIEPGDDLAALLLAALADAGEALQDGDVLVLAQKIVSKAEGRYAVLEKVMPSPRAEEIAAITDKDPRLVELILSESTEIVRRRKGVLVVAHNIGIVMANAGIDASNVEPSSDGTRVLLLPKNPDASAVALRESLGVATGADIAVIVNDSVGRAWRNGTVGIALGSAGLPALNDLNGTPDLFGRPLQASQVGLADELAATASLMMGQANEGRPVVLIRGLGAAVTGAANTGASEIEGTADDLIRPREQDLFR
jgi:coenzyme F420-0:L-glutamate ligase/coenzyme F420-1:gamma-L-glutamate ligase